MNKCPACGKNVVRANGCSVQEYRIEDKTYKKIPVIGVNVRGNEKRCVDCGARIGYFHHVGCDQEICPKCGMQILGCECEGIEYLLP